MKSPLNSSGYSPWLADAPLPNPQNLSTPAPDVATDPLIDKGGQTTIYIGSVLLIIALSAVVGILSRRIEHALFVALALSTALIVIVLLPGH